MPQLVATAVFPLLAGLGFVGNLTPLALGIGYAVTGAALYGLSLLAPRPKMPTPEQRDIQANIREAVGPRRRIYSLSMVGSKIVFGYRRGTKNYIIHYVGEGPIGGFQQFILDNRPVTLDANGFVTDEQYQFGGRSRVQILTTIGTMADEPFDEILAAFPELDRPLQPFRHRGCAMALQIVEEVAYEHIADVYPNNLPSLKFIVEGLVIEDPRSGIMTSSGNAGVCLLAECCDVYGFAPDDAENIDLDAFASFADHSDENIGLKSGGTEPRYRCAGTIQLDAENEDRVNAIAQVCNADVFIDRQGRLSVRRKLREEPAITLSAANGDHLSVSLATGSSEQKRFNTVKIVYVEAALNWKENEVVYANPAALEEDGKELTEPLSVPLCPSGTQAQRVGKLFWHERNPEFAGSLTSGAQALELLEDHVLAVDLRPEDDLVITANASGIEFNPESFVVSCGIRSIAPGATSWDPDTEERDPVESPPPLPSNVDDVPLDVTATVQLQNNSAPILVYTWMPFGEAVLPDSYTQQVQIAILDTEEWIDIVANREDRRARSGPVADLTSYKARIRNLAPGKTFDWQEIDPVFVQVNTTPPGAIVLDVDPATGGAAINITTPSSNAPAHVAIYRQAGTGGTLDRETDLIAMIDVGPTLTYTLADGGLAAGSYSWWAEPFNVSSVAGPLTGPVTGTVL